MILFFFTKNCYTTVNEMHNVLSYNKIWKQRLINIGSFSIKDVENYGLTGILARCVGLKRDLRLSWKETYSNYNNLIFKSYIGINGDSYDRYLIRMMEMKESLQIVNQCVNKLYLFLDNTDVMNSTLFSQSVTLNNKKFKKESEQTQYMEDLINHFLKWHTNAFMKTEFVTVSIESPKGEFGVALVSDNTNKPYRCKVRSPSYHNLQFLPKLIKGHLLADLSTLIGTIDIVFGEIDR